MRKPIRTDPRRIDPFDRPLHNYVVIDTETTGLDPYKGSRLLEIGAVCVHHDRIVDTFETLVNPHQHVPGKITQLTGITDAMTQRGVDAGMAVRMFASWLHPEDILLAHNAPFDMSFLDKATRDMSHDRQRFFPHLYLDTLQFSRQLHPERRSHRVANLIRDYDIADHEEHRALSDATQEERLYRKMREEYFAV